MCLVCSSAWYMVSTIKYVTVFDISTNWDILFRKCKSNTTQISTLAIWFQKISALKTTRTVYILSKSIYIKLLKVKMYGAVKKKKLMEDDLFSNLVHIYL